MTLQQHSVRQLPPDGRLTDAAGDVDTATAALFVRLRAEATTVTDRRRLRDEILCLNLPFATRLARRYRDRGQHLEDLEQVAALALVKAVDSFDPARGSRFFGYLVPTVLGEIKRHFRDKGWDVHVCRRLQERHLELTRTAEALTHRLGRPPSAAELAAALDITGDQLREAQLAGSVYDIDSLNATVSARDDSCERGDLVGVPDRALESVGDRLALRDLLRRLPPRDKFIVGQYFFAGASQEQIARALGMSQMNVSRLLRRTLERLRGELDGDGTPPHTPDPGRTRTSGAGPGTMVVAAHGDLDDAGAVALRDAVIDAAVRHRPKRIIVDLRHTATAGQHAVRALVDGYRACGHSGSILVAVNVPDPLLEMLRRFGVVRLFACHPRSDATRSDATPSDATRSDPVPTDATPVTERRDSCGLPSSGRHDDKRRLPQPCRSGVAWAQRMAARWWPGTLALPAGGTRRPSRSPIGTPVGCQPNPTRSPTGRRPRAP